MFRVGPHMNAAPNRVDGSAQEAHPTLRGPLPPLGSRNHPAREDHGYRREADKRRHVHLGCLPVQTVTLVSRRPAVCEVAHTRRAK